MSIVMADDKLGRVGELMTEIVCVIDETSTAGEAREELVGAGVTGAPVMRGETIVGVVSQTDLMRAQEDEPIRDVMTEAVYAVRPEDPAMLAVRLMVERVIHRVIVVNDAGQLQGVLSAMDVLGAIANRYGSRGELRYVDLRKPDGSAS